MSDFLLADGFGNLSDGNHLAGTQREILGEKWTGWTGTFVVEDIGDGRKWLKVGSAANLMLSSSIASVAALSVCFRVYPTSRAETTICGFYDSANVLGYLRMNTNGQLEYVRGVDAFDGTVVATSSVLPVDVETHVEIAITFHDSTGAVEIFLNGLSNVAVTNQDTIRYGTECDIISWMAGVPYFNWPTGWKLTDCVVHVAASPIGDVGVYYVEPDADGADGDFTPSAGDNFECVDDIGPDEDTTYNESDGTAGHRDSVGTAGVTGMTVLSVGVLVRARKTDTGTATLLLGAIHGASEDQSAAKGLAEGYLTLVEFFDDCPSGGAWDETKVAAASLSYEVGA